MTRRQRQISINGLVPLVVVTILVLASASVSAQSRLTGETAQAATTELMEAQIRAQLREQRQMFPRTIPDEVHGQMERESRRARRSIGIILVTCLAFLFFLVLPLFEREKDLTQTGETHRV